MNHPPIMLLIALSMLALATAEPCKQTGPCKCERSSGQVLDLSTIPGLPLSVVDSISNTWKYSPCSAITGCSTPPTSSKKSGVCQKTIYGGFNFGDFDSAKIADNSPNPIVTYETKEDTSGVCNLKRSSSVELVCSESATTPKLTITGNPAAYTLCTLTFKLEAKQVCWHSGGGGSGGISIGDVLLIIFFVGLLIYFVAGALFMRFVRHAEVGLDLIIHRGFWCALPLLARDGAMFVADKTCLRGRSPPPYEAI